MLKKLWLYPPLAFARLGRSPAPLENFEWGASDLRPNGTGKTTVNPVESLSVDEEGVLSSTTPTNIVFRDENGIRPVCPFFELYGEWTDDSGNSITGGITDSVLATLGLSAVDVRWTVEVANLKAFHFTLDEGDAVRANVEIIGNQTTRVDLHGTSPKTNPNPLVPDGQYIPFGSVQLAQRTDALPEYRLRFYPPTGQVFGPTDLKTRTEDFMLPDENLFLNPNAAWPKFVPQGDYRTNPGGLYPIDGNDVSLGMIDDVSDGVIRCFIGDLPAAASRIVVGPPAYAPDRRPFVSLAEGLSDRVKRLEVYDENYVLDFDTTTLEVRDLFERILETMGLMNLDVQNDRARRENAGIAGQTGLPPEDAANRAFPPSVAVPGRDLPLTQIGREMHRRFVSLEVFEDILRERSNLLETFVRAPMTGERYYDRKMPALMRGSDRYPMHLTRRQYELLHAWAERIRRDVDPGA